jgi:hypothetical protein
VFASGTDSRAERIGIGSVLGLMTLAAFLRNVQGLGEVDLFESA